jgi:lysophospholipase L1-like esterase
MRSGKKVAYKRKSSVLPVLVSFLLVVGAAYGTATLWQNQQEAALAAQSPPSAAIEESTDPEDAPDESPSLSEDTSVSTVAAEGEDSSSTPESTASEGENSSSTPEDTDEPSDTDANDVDEPAQSSEISEILAARREKFPYALEESEPVSASYFDDAIFFGDSISTGIPLYNVMPNAKVIAFTGIATVNALTSECIDTDSGRKTMLDAALAYGDKKKVYIMLGGNGLGYDEETFIAGYREFVDGVKAQYPKATIYIQSMTPVTDYAYLTYPSVSNELIENYNIAIHDMAKEKGVVYLDVAEALMNDAGKLPETASPVDGMHFTPEYYAKWFAYLRNHAIPDKASES